MRRFILHANITRFAAMLEQEWDAPSRVWLMNATAEARRELALIEARSIGVAYAEAGQAPSAASLRREFEHRLQESSDAVVLIDAGPRLQVVEASRSYARMTMTEGRRLLGEPLFDVFPDNPTDPLAQGVTSAYASLRRVSETGRSDAMARLRYDIRDRRGEFVRRDWRICNAPVFDETGRLVFIMQTVQDLTARADTGPVSALRRRSPSPLRSRLASSRSFAPH